MTSVIARGEVWGRRYDRAMEAVRAANDLVVLAGLCDGRSGYAGRRGTGYHGVLYLGNLRA
jgi:hypothetical protein